MIKIRVCKMGNDKVFLVTGGTAHIGATATAYVASDGKVCVDVISLPGHRERELAEELAAMAAVKLGCTVAVMIGIHMEKPSKQEIAEVVEGTHGKMRGMLEQCAAESDIQ